LLDALATCPQLGEQRRALLRSQPPARRPPNASLRGALLRLPGRPAGSSIVFAREEGREGTPDLCRILQLTTAIVSSFAGVAGSKEADGSLLLYVSEAAALSVIPTN
jgi:hypothetical protein